jgi:ankyrin repeat protein
MRLWKAVAARKEPEEAPLSIFINSPTILNVYRSPLEVLASVGNTALHQLCCLPNTKPNSLTLELVRILVEAGAHPSQANHNGITAFHFAVWTATTTDSIADIVRFLLEYASTHGHWASTRELDYDCTIDVLLQIDWGEDGLVVDYQGTSPIGRAVDRIRYQELLCRVRWLLAL